MKIIHITRHTAARVILRHKQRHLAVHNAEATVRRIIADVQEAGDSAVRRWTKKLDQVELKSFWVSEEEINRAVKSMPASYSRSLRHAMTNILRFHKAQLRTNRTFTTREGAQLGFRFVPVERVGIYIPGGKAAYPSTVLMNVIPAKVAGVREIIIASPPSSSGSVHPAVLGAAGFLGIRRILRIGGAQAIAALAFGTKTVPKVDVITGPGNIYVATAKKLVFGTVGIDSIAGPSEIAILADASANPAFIAADLIAQAEHDSSAVAIAVTTSESMANAISREIRKLSKATPRRVAVQQSLSNNGFIVIADSLESAIQFINELAPEHLEVMTKQPERVAERIRNAGAIFIGRYSPVALGDYWAGPNHVLPTNGTARFASPLSVWTFMKMQSVLKFSRTALKGAAHDVTMFALQEGFFAHADSINIRLKA